MKVLLNSLLLALCLHSTGQIAVIPQPASIKTSEGAAFELQPGTTIGINGHRSLEFCAQYLRKTLEQSTGFSLPVIAGENATIQLDINSQAAKPEGYSLQASNKGIRITGGDAAGVLYGIQTLLQLLPPAIHHKVAVTGQAWTIPPVTIEDAPRFGWRGLMLDVARHFFTVQEVKDFIDVMARYKFNLLHWHLTDDEGWRIEIKKYPQLTRVGAWNVKKTGYFGDFKKPAPHEPRNYGGFYTQDEIREIVAYARERAINIMPEVDVPGHSLAAIASYPELSCTEAAKTYVVRSGEKIMDWHGDGKFTALVDNTLCPANEQVYTFLGHVFDELTELFPFEYIHVGGDECATNFWEKSAAIKALMQREKLKNLHAVQAYFEQRVARLLQARGKKMIGWDEILEGGLPPSAAVMSWRGEKGGIEAAKQQHEVVMTPTTFCYLDYMQADPVIEPRVYAALRLQKVYQFNPVPPGVDARFIKGGQGNIWTEQMYQTRHLQYMVWPRAFALAECLWTNPEQKNWSLFVPRVEAHFKRFDVQQIKYAPSMYDPDFRIRKTASGSLMVEMSTEIEGLSIHYSFDNSFPDQFYPRYEGPIEVPADAVTLKVITYRGQTPVGRTNWMPVEEMRRRVRQ